MNSQSAVLQFRALSDQLFRTPHMHMEVRQMAVRQLQARPELYQGFADDEFMHYCAQMSQPGAWGDHISLQAAADAFGLRIFIISSYELACVIEIKPNGGWRSERILYLSFWHEARILAAVDSPTKVASNDCAQAKWIICRCTMPLSTLQQTRLGIWPVISSWAAGSCITCSAGLLLQIRAF